MEHELTYGSGRGWWCESSPSKDHEEKLLTRLQIQQAFVLIMPLDHGTLSFVVRAFFFVDEMRRGGGRKVAWTWNM